MERWIDIIGFEGVYQISDHGRILTTGRVVLCAAKPGYRKVVKQGIKKLRVNKYGYQDVRLWKNSKSYPYSVHKLVAIHFLDDRMGRMYINHKDGIKTNNHYLNLEWCTPKQNTDHAIRTGLKKSRTKESFCTKEINAIIKRFSKPVYQCLEDGCVINSFQSIKIASEHLRVSPNSLYTAIYRGSKSHGFYWKIQTKSTQHGN